MVRSIRGGRLDNCWSQPGSKHPCQSPQVYAMHHGCAGRLACCLKQSCVSKCVHCTIQALKPCSTYRSVQQSQPAAQKQDSISHLTSSLLCDCSAAPCAAMPLLFCGPCALIDVNKHEQRDEHYTMRDVSTRACVIPNLKACAASWPFVVTVYTKNGNSKVMLSFYCGFWLTHRGMCEGE